VAEEPPIISLHGVGKVHPFQQLEMSFSEANISTHAGDCRPKRKFSRIERRATDSHHPEATQYEQPFHYKPLDRSKGAVRLIKVYPLHEDGRIRCRIERHHISSADYVALSYVWGLDDAHITILMNGQDFRVRPNLYAFLRHVAKNKHFSDTLFWIDAISINQLDVSEKNGHVRHMGAIYSRASRVIAWLGHSSGPQAIGTKPPNRWICCDQFDSDTQTGRKHSCDWKVPSRTSWEVVIHPYWSRLWIAQELGLANRVDILWRGRFYNWFRLKKHLASNLARERQLRLVSGRQRTSLVVNLEFIRDLPIARYFKRAEAEPLGNLVPRFAFHECQVGHDHAYALLSLASDGGTFEPDYNESCISLLLRLMTFCYSHPTATFSNKIGSALGLDPTVKGIAVDFLGHPRVSDHSINANGVQYRLTEDCSDTMSSPEARVVIRLPDTNLHLMFHASPGEDATSGTTYSFVSRIETTSGRVEQAKNKFGHRSKKDKGNLWVQGQGVKDLRDTTLTVNSTTSSFRFHASWRAVLALFELSETQALRGRLESRIRSWTMHTDLVHEQRQGFTISK